MMNAQQIANMIKSCEENAAVIYDQAGFAINQIVKGHKAGVFVILGFREIGGEKWAQLKTVNPDNHSQAGRGELALPLSALRPLEPAE